MYTEFIRFVANKNVLTRIGPAMPDANMVVLLCDIKYIYKALYKDLKVSSNQSLSATKNKETRWHGIILNSRDSQQPTLCTAQLDLNLTLACTKLTCVL